jgi:hypothetical protein
MDTGGRKIASVAWMAIAIGANTVACGSAPPPVESSPKERQHRSSRPIMSIESEIGALDEVKVEATFKHASPALMACFSRGSRAVPYLSGDVRFVVRVNRQGEAVLAYVKESNLGDRSTEECMLDILKAEKWPSPQGGNEGLAENGFSFEPGSDERPPVDLTEDNLGKAYRKEQAALSRCRSDAGAGPIKATMYIDTAGKPVSVGASSDDERGEKAIACIVSALREITFPSPGSYAGKVTITID